MAARAVALPETTVTPPDDAVPDPLTTPSIELVELLTPLGRTAGRFLDAVACGLAATIAVVVGFDSQLPGRPALALAFYLVVPGWAILRALGAGPSSLTAFCAIAASVALAFLAGEITVTLLDWAWEPVAVGLASVSAVLTGFRVVRP